MYGTPLVSGLFPECSEDVYNAYHDPNVHVFLSIVFGIFALVFLFYVSARFPKIEYGLMFGFCARMYSRNETFSHNSRSRSVCSPDLF